MTATVSSTRASQGDIQLWVIALGISLVINLLLGVALAFWVIKALQMSVVVPEESMAEERVVTIMPDWTPVPDPAQEDLPKRFARTSPEQTAPEPPKTSAFEGERNTQATSDRAAMVSAPELPSQQGIEPRDPNEFETTESRFQDGRLDEPEAPVSLPSETQPEFQPPTPEPAATTPLPPSSEPVTVPPQREKAFEGPNPVDVAAQPDITPPKEKVEPTPPREELPPEPQPEVTAQEEAPKETPKPISQSSDPAFSGFQQKTAIVGSISRTGQSALDVEDSPMGRYQAAISRAVELEWQRNCVRHRDFITPGFLTVRFFVEASGKVRSVQFAGDMETGEVQKGFTLNSIRDAPIPKMPDAVKKEQKGEPMELVFRFYF